MSGRTRRPRRRPYSLISVFPFCSIFCRTANAMSIVAMQKPVSKSNVWGCNAFRMFVDPCRSKFIFSLRLLTWLLHSNSYQGVWQYHLYPKRMIQVNIHNGTERPIHRCAITPPLPPGLPPGCEPSPPGCEPSMARDATCLNSVWIHLIHPLTHAHVLDSAKKFQATCSFFLPPHALGSDTKHFSDSCFVFALSACPWQRIVCGILSACPWQR